MKILLLLILFGSAQDLFQATCRVNRGTGIVFAERKDHFKIMTVSHVVTNENGKIVQTTVEFFGSGYQSHKMPAKVIWCYPHKKLDYNDLAILTVPKTVFGDYPFPKTIPMAPKGFKSMNTILSCGCPNTRWPSLWKGHIITDHGDTFTFAPIPIQGRSGSPVTDDLGEKVIGIIIQTSPSYGRAVSLQGIYKLTQWDKDK